LGGHAAAAGLDLTATRPGYNALNPDGRDVTPKPLGGEGTRSNIVKRFYARKSELDAPGWVTIWDRFIEGGYARRRARVDSVPRAVAREVLERMNAAAAAEELAGVITCDMHRYAYAAGSKSDQWAKNEP
jgi:hypothetical protein